MKKNVFFLYSPIRVIDRKKGDKIGGPLCIKLAQGTAYLAFKTKDVADYCRGRIADPDVSVIRSDQLGGEYPELLVNKKRMLLFEDMKVYREYLGNRESFNYDKHVTIFER